LPLSPATVTNLRNAFDGCKDEVFRVLRAAAHKAGGPLPVRPNVRGLPPIEGTVLANDGDGKDDAFQHGCFTEQGAQTGTDAQGNPIYAVVAAKGLTWAAIFQRIDPAAQPALRYLLRRCKCWVQTHDARTDLGDLSRCGATFHAEIRAADDGKTWEAARGWGIAAGSGYALREKATAAP